MWTDFKPALWFLGKFLAIYVIGNIAYGIYIRQQLPSPDSITMLVSKQVAWLISKASMAVDAEESTKARVSLVEATSGRTVINVFEGCNGINVMVVFAAFLVAYGGNSKRLVLFMLLGFVLIHIANLARLWLLFEQARAQSVYFYYFHKYLFTAFIYFFVVLLWIAWAWKLDGKPTTHSR